MQQFTPHILPLDFRSRNMHNKQNKINQYNKQFTNNVKIIDRDYKIPLEKNLGNIFTMMVNDETDITSGCDNLWADTNIFNNYIKINASTPTNLFADYTINRKDHNIYNSIINNTYDINNVTDVANSAIFRRYTVIKPKIITETKEIHYTNNQRYSSFLDSANIHI